MAARPIEQTMTAAHRAFVTITIALVAGLVAAALGPWQLAPLVGWIAGGAWWLGSVWLKVRVCTAEQTEALATREDDSRFAAELLLVSASIRSFARTGFVPIKGNQTDGRRKA